MKTRLDRRIIKRFSLVLVMAFVLISSMPIATGTVANAAETKPGAVYTIKATDITSEAAKLQWTKASGKVSGYAIYKNGKYVTSVKNNKLVYQDKKLKYSTNYKYYVRAFRYTGKKTRQYYNTKTKKWQKKAPTKKYLGKTRLVKGRVYGAASPTLLVTTTEPTMIYGKAFTPSMCPKSFIKKGTECKECGKGQTVKVTFKNGKYAITISGTDRSKKCNHK